MAYITKDEARLAARARLQKSYGSSATQILREEVRASAAAESFDIFLSHSSEDAEIVLGVREILVGLGLKVYIDWIDDPQLDNELRRAVPRPVNRWSYRRLTVFEARCDSGKQNVPRLKF